jgi:hypothetical protein
MEEQKEAEITLKVQPEETGNAEFFRSIPGLNRSLLERAHRHFSIWLAHSCGDLAKADKLIVGATGGLAKAYDTCRLVDRIVPSPQKILAQ